MSKGEFLISQLLTQKNILFIKEYSFNDLKGKNNKTYLRFDFAIINSKNKLQLLLEFHGRQHFKDENNWNGESFKERKHRDNLKSEYCLKNKILLITINYSDDIIEKINNMADLLATGKLSPTKE